MAGVAGSRCDFCDESAVYRWLDEFTPYAKLACPRHYPVAIRASKLEVALPDSLVCEYNPAGFTGRRDPPVILREGMRE
jgi:hypothetical protein